MKVDKNQKYRFKWRSTDLNEGLLQTNKLYLTRVTLNSEITDKKQYGPSVVRSVQKKDRGPIFSQYGPEQAWSIRDLLHN